MAVPFVAPLHEIVNMPPGIPTGTMRSLSNSADGDVSNAFFAPSNL
jgi:phosphoribosylcarboxyaminoimidazole (NCAIR) mutase